MLADEGFIDDIDDNENIPSLDQLSLFEGCLSMNQLSLESREGKVVQARATAMLIAQLTCTLFCRPHL